MNREGEPAKIALGLLKLTVPCPQSKASRPLSRPRTAWWLIYLALVLAVAPTGTGSGPWVWVLGPPRIGADFRAKLLSLIGRWLPVVSCPIHGGGVV